MTEAKNWDDKADDDKDKRLQRMKATKTCNDRGEGNGNLRTSDDKDRKQQTHLMTKT